MINIAVVGATGMVGRTFLKVLEEKQLPLGDIYLYASAKSAGQKLHFYGEDREVRRQEHRLCSFQRRRNNKPQLCPHIPERGHMRYRQQLGVENG